MDAPPPLTAVPLRGDPARARVELGLLGAVLAILLVSGVAPKAGHQSWLLETAPGIAGVAVLIAVFRRFPMSRWVYAGVVIHMLILAYGGYYTYALTPLGDWAKEAFGLARNHYDRVGHLALGFFPAFIVREVLLRVTPLRRGGWLVFLVLSVVLAIGAFWELLEWWWVVVAGPEAGESFLGSQGDVWDAQWDMFLALVGSAIGLALFSRAHDRSMDALVARWGAAKQ